MTPELRWALGLPFLFAFACAVFRWPAATVVAVLFGLPFLALARRMLLLFVPWASQDPFLLIAPTVAALYCVVHPAFSKPWNLLTRLVVIVLAVCTMEAVSPLGAGEAANLAGALFLVVPLLWYFVGRHLPARAVDGVLRQLPLLALPIAGYGLGGIFFGLPPWDQIWVQAQASRYAALYVAAGAVRPFGTFASAAEYETFVYLASTIAFGLALRSRGYTRLGYGLVTGILWFAGFLSASRGVTIFSVAAMAVLWASTDPRRRRVRLVGASLALGALYGILVLGHQFGNVGGAIGAFVQHQAEGLSQPLNPKNSTALQHVNMLWNGLVEGFQHPLGQGLGIVTLAGSSLGTSSADIEVDFANLFVAGGVVAGVAYLAAGQLIVRGAFSSAARRLAEYVLPGMLLILLFNWLNGQYYFLCPLLWVTIGNTLGRTEGATASEARRRIGMAGPGEVPA
jgi:hypothetical protein